ALLLAASPAAAQQATEGPRWQAWYGCWQTSADAAAPADAATSGDVLCVVPSETANGAEFVSVADGVAASRTLVRADGERQTADREGCTGWESAEWGPGGTRLYLQSEFRCEGG